MKTFYSLYMLGIIVLAFVLQLAFPPITDAFVFNPETFPSQPWTAVTSMFLHGGVAHLFLNGLALFMFGPLLESIIGGRRFLLLYFASGIAGSLFYYLFIVLGISPPIPALGASGAIFGVLGMLAVLRPNMMIYVSFIPMPMYAAAAVWFLMEFFGAFNTGSGIASSAHLGGLVLGLAYGWMEKGRFGAVRMQRRRDWSEY
jgi:membrane associated rhomboid family serine protease